MSSDPATAGFFYARSTDHRLNQRSWDRFNPVQAVMKSFEDTDSRPYDRHRYRVIFTDGSIQDVASYAEATDLWYVDRRKARLIEVLPAKKQGGRPGRSGFG